MHIDLWPVSVMWRANLLWRVSLLTLGCEAAPKPYTATCLNKRIAWSEAASRPSASKLARHSEAGTREVAHSEALNRGQGGICL